jgi:hypothetical protein
MGIEAGGGGKGGNPDGPKSPNHNQSPEGIPHNIDPKTLRVVPEQRRFGSGFQKPESQGIQRADKPTSARPFVTEADREKSRAINERWRAIDKKMERYTQEQEAKIDREWFDRSTAWLKSHGFTSKEDITPEKFTPEQQLVYAIETAAMLEDIMEQMDKSLDEEQET